MKLINDFIIEKLHINSKTSSIKKNYLELTNRILKMFLINSDDVDDELLTIIEEWIEKNDIKSPIFIANKETLYEYKKVMPANILVQYVDGYSYVEECQYKLDKSKQVYKCTEFDLFESKFLLAKLDNYGALYCIPNDTI